MAQNDFFMPAASGISDAFGLGIGTEAVGADAGGFSWGSLFQDKEILNAIAGLGASIGGKGSVGAALGGMAQQMIKADSYSKLVSGILSGEQPPEGVKLTRDGSKTNIEIANTALGNLDSGSNLTTSTGQGFQAGQQRQAPETDQPGMAQPTQPTQAAQPIQTSAANPFAAGLNSADTAGLTAENISQGLRDALGIKAFNQKQLTDEMDMKYQASTMQTQAAQAIEDAEPFIGGYTLDQWKTLTPNQKEYASYKQNLDPNEAPMTRRQFDLLEPTTKERFVMAALKNSKLMKATKELYPGISFNIGDATDKAKAIGEVKQELEITDPQFVADSVTKWKKDAYAWDDDIERQVSKISERYPDMSKGQARSMGEKFLIMDKVGDILKNQYKEGKIDASIEGDTIIWTVDGKEVHRYSL